MGSPFAVFEGKPWAHYLFNEPFEERGHRAMPQRVNDEKMLCGNDHVTRRRQHFRNGLSLKFLPRTQQWGVEFRGLDASNLMPTENRAFGICIGESVAEPISSGIGVALNNRAASWHGRLTYGLAELTCINGYDARSGQDDIASLVRKGVIDEDTKRKVVELLDQHRIMTVATNRPDGWPQGTTAQSEQPESGKPSQRQSSVLDSRPRYRRSHGNHGPIYGSLRLPRE